MGRRNSGCLFHLTSGVMVYIASAMEIDDQMVILYGPRMIEVCLIKDEATGAVSKQVAKRLNSYKMVPLSRVDSIDVTEAKDMDDPQRAMYADLSGMILATNVPAGSPVS